MKEHAEHLFIFKLLYTHHLPGVGDVMVSKNNHSPSLNEVYSPVERMDFKSSNKNEYLSTNPNKKAKSIVI